MQVQSKKNSFLFKQKSLFFPDEKILAIGDIHLGFDSDIKEFGISFSENQFKELQEELKKLFQELKPKKIIIVGDLTHSFSYKYSEKNYFREFSLFLKENFKEKNIILIKGNHDTIDYSFENKMKNFYLIEKILFIHGDKLPSENTIKKSEIIVMGHLHPSVIISDKLKIKKLPKFSSTQTRNFYLSNLTTQQVAGYLPKLKIKKEKFKCYLEGKFLNKKIIVLPSFFSINVGTSINFLDKQEKDFSIIPKRNLKNFEEFVVGENSVYKFGKVKDFLENNGHGGSLTLVCRSGADNNKRYTTHPQN